MVTEEARDGTPLRRCAAAALLALARARARRPTADELAAPALVVAPHPDDETLGCGGTIVAKVGAGARVSIVFASDGAASHAHLMPREELSRLRRREAGEAAAALGVDPADLLFLDLPDGELARREQEGAGRLAEWLEERAVEQVLLPYAGEPPEDHVAAARLARAALSRLGRRCALWEYPVWFWNAWPFVPPPPRGRAGWRSRAATAGALLRDLDLAVPVAEHLASKRAALACHGSQVRRPEGRDGEWPVLGDVAGGAFLQCLLRPYEFFSVRAG